MSRDKSLAASVEAELKWDPRVDADHFGVSVHSGGVTLSGFASSFPEKLAAVQAAERVHGVQAIADEIVVRVPAAFARDDTKIAETIEQSFQSHIDVPSSVHAEVRRGAVTLSGQVEFNHQRTEANRLVHHIRGVSDVTDLITVKPHAVSPADVDQRVGAALRRNADVDARSIWTTVDNGTVRLHGHVHSFHERQAAQNAAFAAPGVTIVDNQIKVQP